MEKALEGPRGEVERAEVERRLTGVSLGKLGSKYDRECGDDVEVETEDEGEPGAEGEEDRAGGVFGSPVRMSHSGGFREATHGRCTVDLLGASQKVKSAMEWNTVVSRERSMLSRAAK